MDNAITYTIGQKLWLTRQYGNGSEVTVTAVGRKWAQLNAGRYRVGINTREVLGDSCRIGQLWDSREQFEAHMLIREEWLSFVRDADEIRHRPPPALTLEKLAQARQLLGLPPTAKR